jgi:hypothetical protein
MKKHLIIFGLITSLFAVSCTDQLERLPIDQLVAETAFQSVGDLEAGLRGAIASYDITEFIAFNAIFADNSKIGRDTGGQQQNLHNQVLNAQTNYGFWQDRYNFINNINRVLVGAEGITPAAGQETTDYNNVVGMCLAFRAFAHSELLLYYGFDTTNGGAAGIPYQNTVSTSDQPVRLTTAEVYALIDADFTEAASLITNTDISFPTQDFITFQRVRNAVYSGNYSTAVTLATSLINSYPLANADQYRAMFVDADVTEVIYRYDNVLGANQGIAFEFQFTGGNHHSEMSNGLYDSFDPADVRFAVNVRADSDPNGVNANSPGLLFYEKYPEGSDGFFINDFKSMRISEIYLLRAEAYAMQSQFGPAAADVQAIRTIRNSPVTGTSYSSIVQAISDIKDERRIELALEGHRYVDIKRYREILGIGIERDPRDCPGGQPCSIAINDRRFILPLPFAELNGNPNIQQAPGYE